MKSSLAKSLLLSVLTVGIGLTLAGRVTAQTFTTLHNFTPLTGGTKGDGANPYAGLISSGNTLYGTAKGGGSSGDGTVFALNTNGTGFTNLYYFTSGSDGGNLNAGLILSNNILYGAADDGGSSGNGTVFAFNITSSNFQNLHNFSLGSGSEPNLTNNDGDQPFAALVLSGNNLYGTAFFGGTNGNGTVFTVNTTNMAFTNLHSFAAGNKSSFNEHGGGFTNSEGGFPQAGLILSGNSLYGVGLYGGLNGNGTVFGVNTDGTGFTNLHNFAAGSGSYPNISNSDGFGPHGTLILSGNTLYGTAALGGTNGNGTVFAVNTNGMGFTNLHSFAAGSGSFPHVTNSGGAAPEGGLVISGNTLYGTTYGGGTNGNGTVFALKTNGTGFTTLYTFTATDANGNNSDGANPIAGLLLSGNTLYGTTSAGGTNGTGTVFSLSLQEPPQLTITDFGANVILTWPTNFTGYTLQSATNPALTNWTTVSPSPVPINGQNTVTNAITGALMFYRLSRSQ